MMYDFRPDGQPILTTFIPVEKVLTTQPTQQVEGAGLSHNKSKTFTNFKISSNPETKQKVNKFINLKL